MKLAPAGQTEQESSKSNFEPTPQDGSLPAGQAGTQEHGANNTEPTTADNTANNKTDAQEETGKEIPEEFFAYIGKITKISDNQIILNTLANNNNLLEDKILTVNLTVETIFTKILIPQILTGDEKKDKIQKIEIQKIDLKNNQTVLVEADENVANKTEFFASRVEVQEVN